MVTRRGLGLASEPVHLGFPRLVRAWDRSVAGDGGTVLLLAMVATVVAVVFATRSADADVSWLLTAGERWLAGERLYVDVVEVNPPASVMIYVPAILLGRLLGCAPETAVAALTVAGAGVSLALSAAILRRCGLGAERGSRMLLCGALLILTVVPTGAFAEREHIALLLSLPWLACLAARSEGVAPPLVLALLAGMGGGAAMAIKPIFALGFAGPLLMVLARQRWRALAAADLHAAWLVPAVYGCAVLALLPAFAAGPLRWVMLAYVPVRLPLADLLGTGVTPLWLGLLGCSALFWRRIPIGPLAGTAILSSIGFEAAFILQGKGWPYQALPAVLLAGLACWLRLGAAMRTWRDPGGLLAWAAGSALVLAMASALFADQPSGDRIPGLAEAIMRVASHPRMMAISGDIADGHPLVRQVGGRWVGTLCANWITAGLAHQRGTLSPDGLRRLQTLSDQERAIVVHDIAVGRPDVILLKTAEPWTDYVAQSPALAAALDEFRSAGQFGDLILLARRDHLVGGDTPRSVDRGIVTTPRGTLPAG